MQSRLELEENLNELAATRRIQMSWAQVLIGSREKERDRERQLKDLSIYISNINFQTQALPKVKGRCS